jgi:adenylylsulfate kinase
MKQDLKTNINQYTIWLTGRPAAGKSTISKHMYNTLSSLGHNVFLLDGDDMRLGLSSDLGFSLEDRGENIRRAAEVCKMLNKRGFLVIATFISPIEKDRLIAKDIIGENFREIYIKASLGECKKRDPKGLYKKVELGEIKNFTGIDSIYEEPTNPFLIIETEKQSAETSSRTIINKI